MHVFALTRACLLKCAASIGVSLIASACQGPPPLPIPSAQTPVSQPASPQPPVPSFESFSVEGTVWNHTASGPRPLPGLPLTVADIPVVSDAEGRFTLEGFPRGTFVIITMGQNAEYLNPCPSASSWSPLLPSPTLQLDVHVVSRTILLTSDMPPSLRMPWGSVEGVISEVTALGTVPVQGATVELFFPGAGHYSAVGPSAETLTDASGGYAMCSHQEGTATVRARKAGYADALASWFFGRLDLEMTRH